LSREIEVSYPEHRFLAFYVMPLQGTDGAKAAAGAVLILRDVTRDRQNEVQSIESERLRAITLLAAGVAHEIGNPLNSLNIHLQLLKREVQRMPESRRKELGDLLDVSAREVTRLDGIITEFLQAVRPVKPKLESVDFPSLLRESLDFQKHELSDRRVLVESEIAAGLPTVRVDRGQIRQVLFNLVKNASEAMPGGGVLRISVAATDRFVRLSVRDTGVGITPEQMSRIFEPYYTTKTRGSGLGMMIVQRIVRDHGGEIEIHSEPRRGTTVTIFLPREDCLIRMLPARGRNAGEDAP
jgi:signal transduction histidine kinase